MSRSSPQLLRTAYLLTGDRGQADDLLQMTLVRTGQHWFAAQAAPEAYAHRVLINLLHDWRRSLSRRVSERPFYGQEAHRGSVRDHADVIVDRDAIVNAVRALAQRQREVVVLRFFADLSVGETAAAIGVSPGSVKTHTSRALARLREALAEDTPTQRVRIEVPRAD